MHDVCSVHAKERAPEIPDLLRPIDALVASRGDVLLFRQPELFHMRALVNRHTKAPVRFVVGLSLTIRASEDAYGNLEGRRLARLFAQNVRIYVYPMTATDLGEWLKSVAITGGLRRMDGFLPANWGARRLWDFYSPVSSPATFLSLCESLLAPESEEVRRREMSALPVLSRSATGKWCKDIREYVHVLEKVILNCLPDLKRHLFIL